MMESLTEALRLIDQALALLDAVGDLNVAPHLDLAAHRLRERVGMGDIGVGQDSRALESSGVAAEKLNYRKDLSPKPL